MSDIKEPSKVVLDAETKKRVEAAGQTLDDLEKQIAGLEALGFVMTPLRTQIDWSRKARERILKDFT